MGNSYERDLLALRFVQPEVERSFLAAHRDGAEITTRRVFGLGAFIWALFPIWDYLVVPEIQREMFFWRIVVALPILFIGIAQLPSPRSLSSHLGAQCRCCNAHGIVCSAWHAGKRRPRYSAICVCRPHRDVSVYARRHHASVLVGIGIYFRSSRGLCDSSANSTDTAGAGDKRRHLAGRGKYRGDDVQLPIGATAPQGMDARQSHRGEAGVGGKTDARNGGNE